MTLARDVLLLQCSNQKPNVKSLNDGFNFWSLVRYSNTESASAYLDSQDASVAIVDCSGLSEPSASLLSFMERYKGISWIALLHREQLKDKAWSMFVIMHCYDYHTLPVNDTRLLVTLGRAHGMHELRDMAAYPVQRTDVVGKHKSIKLTLQKLYDKSSVCMTLSGESGVGKQHLAKCWTSAEGYSLLDYFELCGNGSSVPIGTLCKSVGAHARVALLIKDATELSKEAQSAICQSLSSENIGFFFIFCCPVGINELDGCQSLTPEFSSYLKHKWVEVPPLRTRGQDKLLLARYYLLRESEKWGKKILGFSAEAESLILDYSWPGNINELKERVSLAVSRCEGDYVTADRLGLSDRFFTDSDNDLSLKRAREKAEEQAIKRVLDMVPGRAERAAELLCISKSSLHRLIARYGIRR